MYTKRIIPCLDVNNGRVVKGTNFVNLRDAGDPIEVSKLYDKAGNTATYTYYQENVKPKPATEGKKGWVCTVCGYIYEGDTLPEDFICPLCKHPASDFEPIK